VLDQHVPRGIEDRVLEFGAASTGRAATACLTRDPVALEIHLRILSRLATVPTIRNIRVS
jgi:hypothetical protein